ncbi:MAG TPA: GNAT family N-acetyltransferase, partial [Sphingopyxis sp.]|nr:GNAT family N-acetyltransferase [Sphingopyxis sp.]
MQGNGEDRANDERLPADARGQGFAAPFDRRSWFDLLEAHGFAEGGRHDARGSAGGVTAWLPLRRERRGHFHGLTNWYSFAIRPLYAGEGDRTAALRALFARLRRKAARLTLYPVPDAEQAAIAAALRSAGW